MLKNIINRFYKKYKSFQVSAEKIKNQLVKFLIEQKQLGKSVAAYGAAAKGNTILNFGGVGPDLLPYVCDAAPSKQGKYMPGSRLPIFGEERIRETKPDFILILPWNLRNEIAQQVAYIREWVGQTVISVPCLEIF